MDQAWWRQLASRDPARVCDASGASACGDGYCLRVLGRDYLIVPGARSVRLAGAGAAVSEQLAGIIVYYLLAAKGLRVAGEWVGLQDLRGGSRFFASGAHTPDLGALLARFAQSPGTVLGAARCLGGRQRPWGDLAVELPVLPRLPMVLVLWAACDEFAARGSVLVDRTAGDQLPLDVLLAAVSEAIGQLQKAAGGEDGEGIDL